MRTGGKRVCAYERWHPRSMATEELGSGSWSGDDDFDDNSLLLWKKYQLRRRGGHHPSGKIGVVGAAKRKSNEGLRIPHPATTTPYPSTGINSSSRATAFASPTGSPTATAVKTEPFSSGLPRSTCSATAEECTAGNRKVEGEEKTEDAESTKLRRRSKIGAEVEEGCVEVHACNDAEETKRRGEVLVSPDRLRTCAPICPSVPNNMETPLANLSEYTLSSKLSLREQQPLSCSTSHVHTHTVCSVSTSSCSSVFTAQPQSEIPVFPSPTSPVHDYSASDYHQRRRRGWVGKEIRGGNSEPVARGVQRRGRGMGGQAGQRRASLQTSLFQFASTVHRSVSDTLRVQWQTSSSSTSGPSDPTQQSLVQGTSEAHGSEILARMEEEGEGSEGCNEAVSILQQRSGRGGCSDLNRECPAVLVVGGCGGGYEVGCSVVQEREVTAAAGSGGVVQSGAVERGGGRGWRRGRRPCPFYKRVPGGIFSSYLFEG